MKNEKSLYFDLGLSILKYQCCRSLLSMFNSTVAPSNVFALCFSIVPPVSKNSSVLYNDEASSTPQLRLLSDFESLIMARSLLVPANFFSTKQYTSPA